MNASRLTRWLVFAAALCVPAAALAGCGDETAPPPPNNPPPPANNPPPAAGAADAGADGAAAAPASNLPPLPAREFQEADFSETDRSRDPFRTFTNLFVAQAKGRVAAQRTVQVDRYALDELKLVGIVTRGPARALLTDPTGLGWVTKVGDFVGKAELVHSGGPTGIDVAVNWRIDRIRDVDVVFIREDPSHPEIPPTTRVLSLRPVEDGENPSLAPAGSPPPRY